MFHRLVKIVCCNIFAILCQDFNPKSSLDFHSVSSLFRAACNVRVEGIAAMAKRGRRQDDETKAEKSGKERQILL